MIEHETSLTPYHQGVSVPAQAGQDFVEKLRIPLLEGDFDAAIGACQGAMAQGLSANQVLSELLTATMREIGDLWHRGEISVADEHLATETALELVSALGDLLHIRPSKGKRVVVSCVPEEFHTLGPRIAAEFLRADGWQVSFLGNGMPPDAMLRFIQERGVDAVVLSMTLSDSVGGALATIRMLKRSLPQMPILLGGPSLRDPDVTSLLRSEDLLLVHDLPSIVSELRVACGLRPADSLEDYLEAIGARITTLRKDKRWSQQELADSAGLDRSYVSSLERGKQNVSLSALKRVADALGVSLDGLIREA
ncbi:MAG: cobalamin-dependent protein [Planctomycetes bacterium]|nr:cobalamin-dependent protein [Planctomycetota bacterium]